MEALALARFSESVAEGSPHRLAPLMLLLLPCVSAAVPCMAPQDGKGEGLVLMKMSPCPQQLPGRDPFGEFSPAATGNWISEGPRIGSQRWKGSAPGILHIACCDLRVKFQRNGVLKTLSSNAQSSPVL